MAKRVERPGVRQGYDRWSRTYDSTPNPVVALDRRYTLDVLKPAPGERILDAGCGTGANLKLIQRQGSRPVGVDFSMGMLNVAKRTCPKVPLTQADLDRGLPVKREVFDAILCALVGEHLTNLPVTFGDAFKALVPGGRFVFSVFHPDMAEAGIEANFEDSSVEYRLGAQRYSVADYLNLIADAGFREPKAREFVGDEALIQQIPQATKYVGHPLLLVVEATRAS
jgi:SAM-dependent methyltransferase